MTLRWAWLSLGLWLTGCPADSPECVKVWNDLCTHQVECGYHPDHQTCVESFMATTECDPSKDAAAYALCSTVLETTTCTLAQPEECSSVLCNRGGTCGGNTPPGHTEVPTTTGGTGGTTGETGGSAASGSGLL